MDAFPFVEKWRQSTRSEGTLSTPLSFMHDFIVARDYSHEPDPAPEFFHKRNSRA